MRKFTRRMSRGFTLVEMLVVLVILGVVITAIFSLFKSTQSSSSTQTAIVDLQQNLRFALDKMGKDIMLAGFLVPKTLTPVANAPDEITDSEFLDLRTATSWQVVGHLGAAKNVDGTNPNETFTLSSAEMVDAFSIGDSVRLVRSPDHEQYIDSIFTVGSKPSATSILLEGFAAGNIATFKQGDMVVKVTPGSTHPETIRYSLVANQLLRSGEVVADGISSVNLTYLVDDGSEESILTSELGDIASIMITIVGTSYDYAAKSTKSRELARVVMIRNR